MSLHTWSVQPSVNFAPLIEEIKLVQDALKKERDDLILLDGELDKIITRGQRLQGKSHNNFVNNEWEEPIAVLVFACNRADALTQHVKKLIA